jgi:hypothetical protein
MQEPEYSTTPRLGDGVRSGLGITVAVMCFISIGLMFKGTFNLDAVLSMALIAGAGALLALQDLGYRLSYDQTGINMRPAGLAWIFGLARQTTISYEDIEAVVTSFGSHAALQRRFMPFDHFRILGRTRGPAEFIPVDPKFLHGYDAFEILRRVREKRPDAVSAEVSTRIDGLN